MSHKTIASAGLLALIVLSAGCASESDSPVERAVDTTKDAAN